MFRNPLRERTNSSMPASRITPACRMAPSKTASSTAMLAVWEAVARAPSWVLPPLINRTGFWATARLAVSRNRRPSRTSSRYIPMIWVCSSSAR